MKIDSRHIPIANNSNHKLFYYATHQDLPLGVQTHTHTFTSSYSNFQSSHSLCQSKKQIFCLCRVFLSIYSNSFIQFVCHRVCRCCLLSFHIHTTMYSRLVGKLLHTLSFVPVNCTRIPNIPTFSLRIVCSIGPTIVIPLLVSLPAHIKSRLSPQMESLFTLSEGERERERTMPASFSNKNSTQHQINLISFQ